MNTNFDFVIEVCALDEKGYRLADNQADLTIIQKLFLEIAWPIYNEEKRRAMDKNNPNFNSGASRLPPADPAWDERAKRIREQAGKS